MRVDLIADTPWYYNDDERYYQGEAGGELNVKAKKAGGGRKPRNTTIYNTQHQYNTVKTNKKS